MSLHTAEHTSDDTRTSVEYYKGLDAFRPVSIYGVVLFHFACMCNWDSSAVWLLRLRDCCLPVFIMTSFFLLTRSLMRDPERSFREFLTKSVSANLRGYLVKCWDENTPTSS